MDNSSYSVCVEDNTLSTKIPGCPSRFEGFKGSVHHNGQRETKCSYFFRSIGMLYIFCSSTMAMFFFPPGFLILLS